VFGFSSFLTNQQAIVDALLESRDVLALMPTGGGKSLCYQLPALMLEGTAIVVSPLIALMKDQVDALLELGVEATCINSSMSREEMNHRARRLSRGELKLVYVAPERLVMPGFLRLLQTTPISLFAIDEAHCISEWGHDFRREYRKLNGLRPLFPDVPFAAFTATATTRVQSDIEIQLALRNPARFRGSFNRPNLYYEVRPKLNAYQELLQYIKSRPKVSGIVYCFSRASTEDLARRLQSDGVRAEAYHAGLENDERTRRQEAFVKDEIQVIVATIAFGMGIDKPDVRFVVHYDLPKTLENYYQESGRAGRDGDPADCILFYEPADAARARHFADQLSTDAERKIAHTQLRRMTDWATSAHCRRVGLLSYFSESSKPQSPPCCDVCDRPTPLQDMTDAAHKFMAAVRQTGQRFGRTYVIEVLRGSRSQRLISLGHEDLACYGTGRQTPADEWHFLCDELLREGLLTLDSEYNVLKVSPRGMEVLRDNKPVLLPERINFKKPVVEYPDQAHPELFERLRALRRRLAHEQSVPAYVIFYDRTLHAMATSLPVTRQELRRIPAIGDRKLAAYGDLCLDVIKGYVNETGAKRGVSSRDEPSRLPTSSGMTSEAIRLFKSGLSVSDIAVAWGMPPRSIELHLANAIESGANINLDELVPSPKQAAIRRAFETASAADGFVRPVLERLGDGYTYGEVRLVRAAMNRDQVRESA
jgi:ATP-dependent DNA helicase RecQ